jgi:uncharacterized protein YdgA (DUF945 family)
MMKKVSVAGALVVLSGIWTGMAWYSGNRAEQLSEQFVDRLNARLAHLGEHWKLRSIVERVSFDRGVFSSIGTYRVEISQISPDGHAAAQRDLVLVNQMRHGPFPFPDSLSGGVSPLMVAGRYTLTTPAGTGDVSHVTGEYRVSYAGTVGSTFVVAPLEWEQDFSRLVLSEVHGGLTYESAADHAAFSLEAERISMSTVRQGSSSTVVWQGVEFDSDLRTRSAEASESRHALSVRNWTQTSEYAPRIQIRRTAFTVDVAQGNRTLDIKMGFDLDGLALEDRELGSIKLMFDAQRMDVSSIHALTGIYRTAAERTTENFGPGQVPQFTSEEKSLIQKHVQAWLAANPILAVQPFEVRTANGASALDLRPEFAESSLPDGMLVDTVLRGVLRLNAKLMLSKANFADLLSNGALMHGVPQEEAIRVGRSQAESIAATLMEAGWAKVEGDHMVIRLEFEEGEITLNDEKIPVERLLDRLFVSWSGR